MQVDLVNLIKSAAARIEAEYCPHCDARLERGDDGNCNRCRKPWPEKRADLNPGVQLRPHQEDAVQSVTEGPDGVLFYHQVGTGKTLSSIATAEAENEPTNVLVPAALRNNYKKEIKKFSTDPAKYSVNSYDRAAKGAVEPRPVAVLDESQRLRRQGAQYAGVLDTVKDSKKRILLSGTPLVNAPGDMAALINLLHGRQLFTPQEFENRFVGTKHKGGFLGFGGHEETIVKNKPELLKLLQDRVHYVPETQDTKPTVNEDEKPVEMGRLQNQIHKTLMKNAPFWLRYKVRHNLPVSKQESSDLNAFLSGVRQNSLSPYGMDKRLSPIKAFEQSPKLMQALQDAKATVANGGKHMFYSNFPNAAFTPMAAALDKEGIPYVKFDGSMSDAARKASIDAYNNGHARVVMIGPAGSEGVSLRGTASASLLDPHWNNARTDQAEGRAVRLDSHTDLPIDQRNVHVTHYVSEPRQAFLKKLLGMSKPIGSDRYLMSRSAEKQKSIDTFLQVLREAGTKI